MPGVEHTIASIQALDKILIDLVLISKQGVSFSNFSQLLKLLADVKVFADNAKSALPEIEDVDLSEAGELAMAGFILAKDVMLAIKA